MTDPSDSPRTNIYVDGFNFYYGAVKGTPYKWCDLATLFGNLLPNNTIHRIRYFTALVQPRPGNPDVHVRQQTYLRALETIPELSIHLGSFRQGTKRMRVSQPAPGISPYVEVLTSEEKGSDVNLAAHLLMDAFRDDFDVAVVVSNDTDLVTPVRMVIEEMHRPVGIINPHARPARDLIATASFYKQVRKGVLSASQFANPLFDAAGTVHKPSRW